MIVKKLGTKKLLTVAGVDVIATPKGFKHGSKGIVIPPGTFLNGFNKGDARKIRKAAHASGYKTHASAEVCPVVRRLAAA